MRLKMSNLNGSTVRGQEAVTGHFPSKLCQDSPMESVPPTMGIVPGFRVTCATKTSILIIAI